MAGIWHSNEGSSENHSENQQSWANMPATIVESCFCGAAQKGKKIEKIK